MFYDSDGDDASFSDASSRKNAPRLINLIRTQDQILKSILTYGSNKETSKVSGASSQHTEADYSDEEQEIEVGDGCFVPRSLFTFKALIFDTNSQNIVAPIMNVGSLRSCNILLH